jgi:hypothetical protein
MTRIVVKGNVRQSDEIKKTFDKLGSPTTVEEDAERRRWADRLFSNKSILEKHLATLRRWHEEGHPTAGKEALQLAADRDIPIRAVDWALKPQERRGPGRSARYEERYQHWLWNFFVYTRLREIRSERKSRAVRPLQGTNEFEELAKELADEIPAQKGTFARSESGLKHADERHRKWLNNSTP